MYPEEWEQYNLPNKILFYVVKLPCLILVKLSVPPADEDSWDPLLAAISPIFGSVLIFITFERIPFLIRSSV